MELLEGFQALQVDIKAKLPAHAPSEGEARIRHILEGEGDDYQRRLYYIVSERPVSDAIRDLEWLTDLLHGRARMVRTLREAGAKVPPLPGSDGAAGDDPTGPIGCRPYGA